KFCEQPNATASNAIFKINKLKAQLQEKDDTIRHLHAEKDILGLLNVGSTESRFKTKALETEIAKLKEGFTSLKIQNNGYMVTNAKLNKCYQELSKANTHLRTTSQKKIATQQAEIATLKAEAVGKKNSGATGTPTKPKVLSLGMYTKSSKTSPRPKQKPPVQHKKPTVPVNMFPKVKPTTEARKLIPKRNTQNHNHLPAKSVKEMRAADYYRNFLRALVVGFTFGNMFTGTATGSVAPNLVFCGGMYFELFVYIPKESTLGFVGVPVAPLFFLPTALAFSVAISACCVAIFFWDVVRKWVLPLDSS
nr:hypothetical protein [Tanacetum cinerariifolium]